MIYVQQRNVRSEMIGTSSGLLPAVFAATVVPPLIGTPSRPAVITGASGEQISRRSLRDVAYIAQNRHRLSTRWGSRRVDWVIRPIGTVRLARKVVATPHASGGSDQASPGAFWRVMS